MRLGMSANGGKADLKFGSAGVRFWLGAEVRAPAWRLPLSGGKQTFVLDVRCFADYVRFSPRSGRIDTVTVESAFDP